LKSSNKFYVFKNKNLPEIVATLTTVLGSFLSNTQVFVNPI